MEQIQEMKRKLIEYVSSKLYNCNLEDINTEELGEVIDMIKDLCEAAYYCSMVK